MQQIQALGKSIDSGLYVPGNSASTEHLGGHLEEALCPNASHLLHKNTCSDNK